MVFGGHGHCGCGGHPDGGGHCSCGGGGYFFVQLSWWWWWLWWRHAQYDDHGDIDAAADQETRKGRISIFCFARCYAGLPRCSCLCFSVRNMQVPVRIFLEMCFSDMAVN